MRKLLIHSELKFAPKAKRCVLVYNSSGGDLVAGDVVVLDPANCSSTVIAVTTTTSQDDKAVYGMLEEDIASAAYGKCQVVGLTDKLKVNGTTDVDVGDLLSTYTVDGIAGEATAGKGGVFAVALEAYTTGDSSGVIAAYIFESAGRADATATTYGILGAMAAAGTSTANAVGTGDAARVDHVHKIGAHDHSGATKGGSIAIAALGEDFFAASATPRATFQADFFDATTVADLFKADSFTSAILDDVIVDNAIDNAWLKAKVDDDALDNTFCDAAFAASAFAADTASRAFFADGIWDAAKLADGCLAATTTGRAKVATDFFNAATVAAKFATDSLSAAVCADIIEDNAIPSGKVNWSYGGVGDIVTIVPDASAATGSEVGVARIDHTHAIVCAAPSGSHVPDSSNAEGSSNSFTRADHVHALPCDAPADGSLAAANAEGAGTTFSRGNHVHKAILLDGVSFNFGTGSDCAIRLSTANDIDGGGAVDLVIAVADLNQSLHITDIGAIATDWNLANTTDPTVYIHSNTTPPTDYIQLSHDGDDGVIESKGGNLVLKTATVESVSFEAAKTHFNAGSANVDFAIESNDVANMFLIDGELNVMGIGVAASANSFIGIAHPAKTLATAAEFATVNITPAGAITTQADSSTYDWLATMYLAEPNIVKGAGDTLTLAATLYILDAPTEATANHALYIASGSAGVQALTAAGLITASGGMALADQNIDFTTGYIEFGAANPAASGNIRVPNNTAVWIARNAAPDGDITGWKVNAADDYEAAADVNLAGNVLYGATAENGDMTLTATKHATVATAYIIASGMIDAHLGGIAVRNNDGAVGDDGGVTDSIDGEIAIDYTDHRFYWRETTSTWKYAAAAAGVQIPKEELDCPKCGKRMKIGDEVKATIDDVMSDGALHALWCHASC